MTDHALPVQEFGRRGSDAELSSHVAALLAAIAPLDLPDHARELAGRLQMSMSRAAWKPRRFAASSTAGQYFVNDGMVWVTNSPGAAALAQAVASAGQWVCLGHERSREAWWGAIRRAVSVIDQEFDCQLASALSPGHGKHGVHLRTAEDGVSIRWVCPPNIRVVSDAALL